MLRPASYGFPLRDACERAARPCSRILLGGAQVKRHSHSAGSALLQARPTALCSEPGGIHVMPGLIRHPVRVRFGNKIPETPVARSPILQNLRSCKSVRRSFAPTDRESGSRDAGHRAGASAGCSTASRTASRARRGAWRPFPYARTGNAAASSFRARPHRRTPAAGHCPLCPDPSPG